jgi:hypothetical protein
MKRNYDYRVRTGESVCTTATPPSHNRPAPSCLRTGGKTGGAMGHVTGKPPDCSPSTPLPWPAPLQPGQGVLLWGEHLRAVVATAAAWGVARHAPVRVVDAANRFDPYRLVREAARLGVPAREALARVHVARAFTSHQLVRLFQETFPASLEPGSLVVVLGPVSLFYDEQVPLVERRRLFQDLVSLLARIKRQSALLLLQPLLPQAAGNQHFGRLLTPLIDHWVAVKNQAGQSDATRQTQTAERPSSPLWRDRYQAPHLPQRGDL